MTDAPLPFIMDFIERGGISVFTEEDLAAIQRMLAGTLNVVIENQIDPKLRTLAEGQQALLEKLAPKSRVEELEEQVDFLQSVLKLHSREIEELKKAQ